jgi:hypothetical protein
MHSKVSGVVGPTPNPQAVVKRARDGVTFDQERDGKRLQAQHARVFEVMKDGMWRSLHAIARLTGDPEASISARLRDLRKDKFGGHEVERRYVQHGLWEYRLKVQRELFA